MSVSHHGSGFTIQVPTVQTSTLKIHLLFALNHVSRYFFHYCLLVQVIPKTGGVEGRRVLGPVKREDAGLYMCTAQNQFGQKTEQMTQVEVLCEYIFRRKTRLVEDNAKCWHLRKLTCKGTLRQVFICLSLRTPYPPLHIVYVYTVYCIYSHKEGGGGVRPERREEGQQFTKLGQIPT